MLESEIETNDAPGRMDTMRHVSPRAVATLPSYDFAASGYAATNSAIPVTKSTADDCSNPPDSYSRENVASFITPPMTVPLPMVSDSLPMMSPAIANADFANSVNKLINSKRNGRQVSPPSATQHTQRTVRTTAWQWQTLQTCFQFHQQRRTSRSHSAGSWKEGGSGFFALQESILCQW